LHSTHKGQLRQHQRLHFFSRTSITGTSFNATLCLPPQYLLLLDTSFQAPQRLPHQYLLLTTRFTATQRLQHQYLLLATSFQATCCLPHQYLILGASFNANTSCSRAGLISLAMLFQTSSPRPCQRLLFASQAQRLAHKLAKPAHGSVTTTTKYSSLPLLVRTLLHPKTQQQLPAANLKATTACYITTMCYITVWDYATTSSSMRRGLSLAFKFTT
jgi:hypothetical protein